jgi:uncharacterized protein (DUF58 family)
MAASTQNGKSPTDIFKRTRRIEIRTSRLVNELFAGQYHSSFKGRGVEFNDVREYIPGDDVRTIHWSLTAKMGHPYIKRFTEERELTILIVVDISNSHSFGTIRRAKAELAAELVSLLAFSSLKNNDKVGLLLFSDQIEEFIPPRKSRSHALRLVRDVLTVEPKRPGTNINQALQYLNRIQKKKAIVFLLSDFIDDNFAQNLSITQRHHDTIAFVLSDPMEKKWPNIGRLLIQDAETGQRMILRGGRKDFKNAYERTAAAEKRNLSTLFKKIKMDHVFFDTDKDYVKPLIAFFKERAQRYRR